MRKALTPYSCKWLAHDMPFIRHRNTTTINISIRGLGCFCIFVPLHFLPSRENYSQKPFFAYYLDYLKPQPSFLTQSHPINFCSTHILSAPFIIVNHFYLHPPRPQILQSTLNLRSFLVLPGIFRAHLRAYLVFLRTFVRIFSPHPPLADQIPPKIPINQ
jgi:hypothetical protein